MSDYKEWSVANGVGRFDFSELPPGDYSIRERKIVRLDSEKDYEHACNKFTEALGKMLDERS